MFDNTSIIDLLFRFINFGILIALGVYGFKRYALTQIRQAIAEKDAQKDHLHQAQTKAQRALETINHALRNQQIENEYLLSRVTAWELAIEKEREEKKQQAVVQEKLLREQATQKAHALERMRLYQEVIPAARAKAHQELEKYFTTEHHQQEFLQNVIMTLEETS